MSQPHRIVIVGGGTAGWMAANLIAHHFSKHPVTVTLVESDKVPTVGVGEGSTPSLKQFFRDLEIEDSQWMPRCQATYKVAIQFNGWSPASGNSSYRHPFISQLDTFSERAFYVNSQTRRLGLDVTTRPDAFLFNSYLAEHKRSPLTPANFPFRMEYGYHFDAGLLGEFLKEHALSLGVQHTVCDIQDVALHPNGDIRAVTDTQGNQIEAELFVDCTGFNSLLLQKALGVRFSSFSENLFNDRAVVLPTPADTSAPVETQATALSAGWAWSIPLQNRTGNGYVYSSQYINDDQAETELRSHLGMLDNDTPARFLSMKVGQVEQHWHRNCLALGLSQGFIEPLEATALHLIQLSIRFFCDAYISGHFTSQHQVAFNLKIAEHFSNVRDYIVAHYKLNTRNDSDYWRDNRNNRHLSENLLQILDTWYRREDLARFLSDKSQATHFGATSWHCLLAGYGAFPGLAPDQPGTGDLFEAHQLADFFNGCLLNFSPSAHHQSD
ncbi:tryptophan 7-halogenase [Salinimonas sp. HHU 13199]|uniref:Tryptophan 7-halogenase n=1 Tax=Salinimonas profundi TaxID=2729140 RepID=A0ABR8LLL2_9ALTE|nr:tryptophan halogenase family protein [Salinimonas profundi]MBD3586213.1 tryptophan 7-halogenase [Salinimonas profundi]